MSPVAAVAGATSERLSLQRAGEYPVGRRTPIQATAADNLQELSVAQPLCRAKHRSSVDSNPTSKVVDGRRCGPGSFRVAIENEPDANLA